MASKQQIVDRLDEINDEIDALISASVPQLNALLQEQADLVKEGRRDFDLKIQIRQDFRKINISKTKEVAELVRLRPTAA